MQNGRTLPLNTLSRFISCFVTSGVGRLGFTSAGASSSSSSLRFVVPLLFGAAPSLCNAFVAPTGTPKFTLLMTFFFLLLGLVCGTEELVVSTSILLPASIVASVQSMTAPTMSMSISQNILAATSTMSPLKTHHLMNLNWNVFGEEKCCACRPWDGKGFMLLRFCWFRDKQLVSCTKRKSFSLDFFKSDHSRAMLVSLLKPHG